jgi:hypothetical protein
VSIFRAEVAILEVGRIQTGLEEGKSVGMGQSEMTGVDSHQLLELPYKLTI